MAPMRHAGERFRREAPVLLWCLATTLVAFRGFFFGGEVLFFRDLIFFLAPEKKIIAQALAAGEWPAWNPYILAGLPLLTEVSCAPLGAYLIAIPAAVILAGRLRDPLAPFLSLHAGPAALHGILAALATAFVTALARRRPKIWILLPALLFLDLLGSGGRFVPTTTPDIYAPPPTAAWVGGERYITSNDAPGAGTDPRKLEDVAWQTDQLRIGLVPNAGGTWGLRAVEGISLLRSNSALHDFLRPKPGENDGGARAYGFLGVRWLVVGPWGKPPSPPWRLARRDEERSLTLYENPLYLPRARLYGTTGRAEILEDGLARLAVRVEADSPGLLLLADSWDPGWSAFRGADEVAVERAGGFLRGVRVPAGPSRIRFEYRAPGLGDGLFLSGAGIILLGLLAMGREREIG